MSEEQVDQPVEEQAADTATEATSEESGEDARTQGQTPKVILKDPRTGQPLRDQTVPAKDTGYLGKHDMQDDTERLAPDVADDDDFKE